MPHGSKYGNNIIIVQERQYRPCSSYSAGSSASRTSGTPSGYYSSTMDSSSSSRSSSTSYGYPDRTGTYRTSGADGYNTTVQTNSKGKQQVVIVHHKTKNSDPNEPRSSDRYRS